MLFETIRWQPNLGVSIQKSSTSSLIVSVNECYFISNPYRLINRCKPK